jgi:hypothetical protein
MSQYSFEYRKGRNRSIGVTAESDDVAKAAANLLVKSIQRKQKDREAVKALTDAAIHWRRQADSITRPSDNLKRFYIEKSRKAIAAAGRIIAEGER